MLGALEGRSVVVVNPALGTYAGRVVATVRADTVTVSEVLLREGLVKRYRP